MKFADHPQHAESSASISATDVSNTLQIPVALDRLFNEILDIKSAVNTLASRLSPVALAVPVAERKNGAVNQLVPIASGITEAARALRELRENIDSLISGLQL